MSMKKVSTQRNSSQFEIIENIVSSKKQVSIQDRVVTRARERKTRYESRTRSRTRTKNEIRVENEVENEIVIRNEIVKIRMIQMLQLKQLMKFVAVEDVKIEVINEVIQ
jgi:UDP-glucose 6-dehydrogenase